MVSVSRARIARLVLGVCALGWSVAAAPLAARVMPPGPVAEVLVTASNGHILFENLADAPRRPASLTKMMTLYLVFDALDSGALRIGESIPVSRAAARQPASRLGLVAGKALPLRTAIRAVAVQSANDVSVALAERLAGSERTFAVAMSAKARQLGMTRTHFANATGLTNGGNRTTARDMATLARALLRDHPRDYRVFATRAITWRGRRFVNHNHLLGKVDGVDGVKTGYTLDAGYNIATSAKRGGARVVAVVLGAKSLQARDVRVANLIELGFTPSGRQRGAGQVALRQRRTAHAMRPNRPAHHPHPHHRRVIHPHKHHPRGGY